MSRIAFSIVLALLASVPPSGARVPAEGPAARTISYPGKSWVLAVDLSGYEVVVAEVGRDPVIVRVRGENFDTGVRVTVELRPADGPVTAEAARRRGWDETRQDGVERIRVRRSRRGPLALLEYVIPVWKGMEVDQRNLHAFLAHDGIWASIHLSKSGFQPADRSEFDSVVRSARIEAEE